MAAVAAVVICSLACLVAVVVTLGAMFSRQDSLGTAIARTFNGRKSQ
jgi:hypothetical protein